ncbi:Fe(III)-pyochelin outer membrane receptor [Pseudomonas aeruginosa]|nr:Fe(III)-pyochelin outer membrane receptor [Pseudomonas aeruginosa]
MKTETKVIKGRQGIARNRHTPLCLGLLLALSPLAAAVADARKDGETELPDMVISGESTSATQPPGVTTLGKVPLKPRELPQSASVIDHERLEQQNLFSLDEAMQQATGVTVQPFQLLTTAYYVRGFKVDSFELDGVPALLGNTASSPQDMAIYERVEILRGSNGLLHGTGNPAATVNLVRKRPQREFAASTTLSAGRWDRYRAEVDVGGPLSASGNVRGRAVAAYEDRDYFYDVADQGTRLLYGVTEFDLSPDTLLTVGAQYQHIDSITNMAGVPMAKDGSNLGLSRDTYLDVDWDRFKWDTYRAFGSLEQQLGGGLERQGQRRIPGSRFAPALRRLLRRHRPADRRRWPADGRRLQVQEHPAQPRRQPQWAGATVRPDPRTARWGSPTPRARPARTPHASSTCRTPRSMSTAGTRTACRARRSASTLRRAPPPPPRKASMPWVGSSSPSR